MTNHEYRKKPVVIKAWQLTSANFNAGIPDFIDEDKVNIFYRFSGDLYAEIETLEGTMRANRFDYIIRGVQGEFYPCKQDIFEQTYEPVED